MNKFLSKNTAKHCAPLIIGNFVDFINEGGDKYITDQGTMTFVMLNRKCYGITNDHVVGKNYDGPTENRVLNLCLVKHLPIIDRPIFTSQYNTYV